MKNIIGLILPWLKARSKEATTYGGIIALASWVGFEMSLIQAEGLIGILVGIAGVHGITHKEK